MRTIIVKTILFFSLFLVLACSSTNDPIAPIDETALRELIDDSFLFTPNQNFEALYYALRVNSNLEWYFNFHLDGSFDVLFTTDTSEDFVFTGTYTYLNNQINLQMDGGPVSPFPNGLNESSIVIMPQFGLVAAFATDQMVAICIGHNLNTQAPPRVNANYGCPVINVAAATSEENAIELVHSAVPTSFPVTGSIFRQKETIINITNDPIIRRGYGIYRQTGNAFFATFSIAEDFVDFAQGQLPFQIDNINAPFDDFNIISGRLQADGNELVIDQLEPEAGACLLR